MGNSNNNFSGIQIEDSENDYSISQLGIKEIGLEQYRRCLVEGSKEMVRGGVTTKIIQNKVIETEIPNQRHIFVNSVESMNIIMIPFLDKENFSEQLKVFVDKKTELDQKKEELVKQLKTECIYYDKNKKKFNSDRYNSEYTKIIDYYELELVDIYRKKLEVFSKLLNYLDYFSEGGASA